jgi:putative oxygen-independent coproporphyrinogen III oxidase
VDARVSGDGIPQPAARAIIQEQVDARVSFSLYIHIPWCHSKCPYCDFNSYAATSWPEAEYTRAIVAEMRERAGDAPYAGSSLKTIFFGGGTPSLFAPASIAAILDAAAECFGIDGGAEITLEGNPGTVNAAKLTGMRTAGVNRLSMGAQSFDDATLAFLGRIHKAADTRDAARAAHRAGFERINLDLIFAVPGQTPAAVMRDIAEAAALEPDHISAYNLTFEEGTAFFADLKRGRIVPLPSDDQAAMYSAVREELPRRGYAMYEISNYARPGHEARHNLTYWRAESYLGLGAGAHSFALGIDGGYGRRWWNERTPARYIEMVSRGARAEAGAEEIDAATGASEYVFLNLRLREGFALADFRARFGREFDELFGERATRLVEGGLIARAGGRLMLTERGVELADSIFAEFV